MLSERKKIIISCESSNSLLSFRGKLIEELVKKNDVIVFAPLTTDNRVKAKFESMGVVIHENDLKRNNIAIWGDIVYVLKLFKLIRTEKPDIFFSLAFKPIIYGSIVASLCRVRGIYVMLTGLGYTFINNGSEKSMLKKVIQGLLRISLKTNKRIGIIFQNADDCKQLIDNGIIAEDSKSFVVNGSGVDLTHYDFTEPKITTISFLMMSRLLTAKGVEEYYEAAKIVREKHPDVKFKLIGEYEDNSIDGIDNQLFAKINAGDVIEYHGCVDDVRQYIKESSVVVLPSYYGEGVPRCLLEALAMGRAVITTNSVGCKETVNPSEVYKNGYLVPVRDVPALVSMMEQYINNPKKIILYGQNGRRYAAERFDVNNVNKHMLQILDGSAA